MTKRVGTKRDLESYVDDQAFHEFLDREFDQVAAVAPLEDLAQFAFGSVEAAILAYEEYKAAIADDSYGQDDA